MKYNISLNQAEMKKMVEISIDVRYPDCDQMAIVHHAVYPIWYEMGRMALFEKCGFNYTATKKLGIDPAMVHLDMNYGKPVRFPQTVTLKTYCSLLQGKKMGFKYQLFQGEDEEPSATAESFHIWVKDGASINIESEFPEVFSAYKKELEQ